MSASSIRMDFLWRVPVRCREQEESFSKEFLVVFQKLHACSYSLRAAVSSLIRVRVLFQEKLACSQSGNQAEAAHPLEAPCNHYLSTFAPPSFFSSVSPYSPIRLLFTRLSLPPHPPPFVRPLKSIRLYFVQTRFPFLVLSIFILILSFLSFRAGLQTTSSRIKSTYNL